MAIGYSRYLKLIYLLGDLLILNLTFCLVSFYFKWPKLTADTSFLAQFIYINFFWFITTIIMRIHEIDRGLRYDQIAAIVIKTLLLFTVMLFTFLYITGKWFIPVFHYELKLFWFAVALFLWRTIMVGILNFMRRRGLNYRNVIIVGNGLPAKEMQRFFISHPEVGYRLKGIFCDELVAIDREHLTGSLADARTFAIKHKIDEIYCSLAGLKVEQVAELMEFADRSLIRFKIVPDFHGFLNKKVRIDFYESVPVLSVRQEPLQNIFNQFQKRSFDIMFSVLVLLIVFPVVYIIVAPLIKLNSKGPVFFSQRRSGLNNEVFTCLKFRTMKINSESDEVQATQGDNRITTVGKFLRHTSLDELPQFFNVLVGKMSVVGPRPHMLLHTEQYSKIITKFMVRHFVKPGITGWAQIHGLRGETREPSLMEKRVEYDVWYLEEWSLLLDIKIIGVTVLRVLSGKN